MRSKSDIPYSPQELRSVAKCLRTLISTKAGDMPLPKFGVCGNLDQALGRLSGYDVVAVYSERWPNSLRDETGDVKPYFIPGTEDASAWHTRWGVAAGEARRAFMRWMLSEVERDIAALAG